MMYMEDLFGVLGFRSQSILGGLMELSIMRPSCGFLLHAHVQLLAMVLSVMIQLVFISNWIEFYTFQAFNMLHIWQFHKNTRVLSKSIYIINICTALP